MAKKFSIFSYQSGSAKHLKSKTPSETIHPPVDIVKAFLKG